MPEINPIGEDTNRFYGVVDVPDGGYVGKKTGAPRIDFDHTNSRLALNTGMRIEEDGTLVFIDDATVYDDLQVGINNIAKGVTAPTDRTYDHGVGGGIAYPVLGFAKNDFIWLDVQTSHAMKLNSILDCHMHFILPNTTTIGHKIVWQLDVLAAGIGGTWAVPVGSPFTTTHTVAADDNTKHRLLDLGDIPASNTTVSSIYKIRLTRIDGTATEYASEVYIEYIDCHYKKDTVGSRTELAK